MSAASVENHRVLLAGREPGWWGMLLLIVTEATLFVYLLASYFYLREANATWPPGGIQRPELLVPAINTVILLSSSIPMWWAESGIRENKQIRLMLGLAISFGLGGLFLLIQGFEYARAGFTPQANAYGSLFYTLTGFHGLHVTVGLVLISVMQVRSWVGHFDASRYLGVQTTAMYWHFVDAVWIFIFGSLYLSPYLFPR